jgi:hypothetical protein
LILHNNSDDRDDDGSHDDSNGLEELGAKQANMSKLAIVKKSIRNQKRSQMSTTLEKE